MKWPSLFYLKLLTDFLQLTNFTANGKTFQFLRLTAKCLAIFRLTVNPIETLLEFFRSQHYVKNFMVTFSQDVLMGYMY